MWAVSHHVQVKSTQVDDPSGPSVEGQALPGRSTTGLNRHGMSLQTVIGPLLHT